MASTSLEPTGSSAMSIPDLITRARDGIIRIPRFQRSYVWDASDVRDLLDSIYRGFPIGMVILWREEAPAGEVSLGPMRFDVQAAKDALWVVDGQQRIISLFGTLAPESEGVDPRFDVYFDLSNQRFVHPRRGVIPPRAIPVRETLEYRRLSTWIRQHGEDLEADDFEIADRLVGVLRDYRISTYVVAKGDEQTLREVFDRVNSAGKPITRAQVFQALFASDTEPGSPAAVVKELARLGFGVLEEDRIVQSLLAIRGGDVQRDVHDEFPQGDDLSDWYDRTQEALRKSISFLRSQGIPHIYLMPNTLPIPVLAAFFYVHPDPGPWILRLLGRWLWRTWVNGDGSQTPALRKAVNAVNPDRLDLSKAPSEYEAVRRLLEQASDTPINSVGLENFRTDSAQGRLILLALASLHPLMPDGSEIDLAREFEVAGANFVTSLIRGYRSNAASRVFWPFGASPISGFEDASVLASHAIDQVSAEHYRAKDAEAFLQSRGVALQELTKTFLNSRLETNELMRPPLDELIIVDETGDLA
jgi:uncharacterized protein DUF262